MQSQACFSRENMGMFFPQNKQACFFLENIQVRFSGMHESMFPREHTGMFSPKMHRHVFPRRPHGQVFSREHSYVFPREHTGMLFFQRIHRYVFPWEHTHKHVCPQRTITQKYTQCADLQVVIGSPSHLAVAHLKTFGQARLDGRHDILQAIILTCNGESITSSNLRKECILQYSTTVQLHHKTAHKQKSEFSTCVLSSVSRAPWD